MAAAAMAAARTAGPLWPASGARAHVLQLGDAAYLARTPPRATGAERRNLTIAALSDSVKWFATVNSFAYLLKKLSFGGADGQCAYSAKVAMIRHTLHALREGDWLLYVDLDMQFACDDARATDVATLASIMPSRSEDDGATCELIAQDSDHVINTGFLALRASAAGRALADAWWASQRRLQVCEYSADQHALQSVVLQRVGADAAQCDELARRHVSESPRPSPNCSARTVECGAPLLLASNLCYKAQLERVRMPYGNRSRGGVCLLPPTARIQRYMGYTSGDLFRHKRYSLGAQQQCHSSQ